MMEATEGKDAHCVYDHVGVAAFTAASKCVAHEGRILAIGFASGSWGPVDTAHMVYQNYAVVGTANRLEYGHGFFVKDGDGSAAPSRSHTCTTHRYTCSRGT